MGTLKMENLRAKLQAYTEESKLQIIINAMESRAQCGYTYLDLFTQSIYGTFCSIYKYDEDTLQALRNSKLTIETFEKHITKGYWWWKKHINTKTLHTVRWD